MAEGHQETAGTGLIPPSHFMLRPSRTLGAELAAERRRSQALGEELEAERRRSQALGEELEALRGRSQVLEAELVAERRRSQILEAELEVVRGRSKALEAELEALRGRGQAQGAEPGAGQPLGQVLLQAQLSALSHILTLQERELDLEVSPPGPCPPRVGTLLGRWRQKVFVLLVQLQVQEEALRSLRGQVRALGTAVAAGTRRVTRLELQLHEGERLRRDGQGWWPRSGHGGPRTRQVTTAALAGTREQVTRDTAASGTPRWGGRGGDGVTVSPLVSPPGDPPWGRDGDQQSGPGRAGDAAAGSGRRHPW
ncbi:coiled-coil alpha-helical rod protein 1-like isoform X3 [Columba livia]|uniref:coiled-coil alpha-helical rod protein 1-like isoform X3 n=1 Tax=Columba livia TaxID=8932 RepID=UPI0031BA754F